MNRRYASYPPLWFLLLLVVITLPAGAAPWLLSALPARLGEMRVLLWLYPLYVLAADWFACICWWPRRLMSWIMVVLILLSHLAVMMAAQDLTHTL